MAQNELSYILKLKDEATGVLKNFGSEINKTDGGLKKFAGASTKALVGLSAAAGVAAAGFATFGLKIAGDMEMAEQGLKAILGSTEAAADTMARIKKEAAATPFELPGLTKGTQALAAITKDGNKAVDILMDVGKAVAVSGKGQAELDRVVLNLQQISATGKVTAMDIKQFQGAIPVFNDILIASGLTADELQNSSNAAELLFDAFKKAGEEGGIAAEGFSAQAGTLNQLISNLKDSFGILASEVVKQSGIMDLAKAGIEALVNFLNNHQEDIINFATAFVDSIKWIVEKAIELKNGVESAIELIKTKFEEFKSGVEAAKNAVTEKFGEMSDFVTGKIEDLISWYEEHETTIKNVAKVLLIIFGPALVKTGVQAVIAGGKIALSFTAQVIRAGTQAVISAGKMTGQFIISIIKAGVQAVITGVKIGVNLVGAIITMGIQAGITAATGLANLIIATANYAISGWAAVTSLIAQTVQIVIYYGSMIISTAVTWAMTAATWAFNAALLVLTSPITLVVLAIVALIAIGWYLITHWAEIKAKAIEIWGSIKTWFLETWNSFKTWFLEYWNGIKLWLEETWNSIKTKVEEVWNSIKENISNLVEGIRTKIVEIWTNIKTSITQKMEEIKTNVKTAWENIKKDITTVLTNTWTKLVETFENWKTKIFDWGKNIAQSFVDGFKNAIEGIKQAAIDAFEAAKGVVMGKSPPKEGPFKNIDQWGFNVGDAWIEGFTKALARVPSEMSGIGGTTNNNTTNHNNTFQVDAIINTPMDAEELALILGGQVNNSGTY